MTQISKEQIECLKFARDNYYVKNDTNPNGVLAWTIDNKDAEALSALITIGDRIASGEYAVVPAVPTDAMVLAWSHARPEEDTLHMSDEETNRFWATADWNAMLAAAKEQA